MTQQRFGGVLGEHRDPPLGPERQRVERVRRPVEGSRDRAPAEAHALVVERDLRRSLAGKAVQVVRHAVPLGVEGGPANRIL